LLLVRPDRVESAVDESAHRLFDDAAHEGVAGRATGHVYRSYLTSVSFGWRTDEPNESYRRKSHLGITRPGPALDARFALV
jgi:hypothetical protein